MVGVRAAWVGGVCFESFLPYPILVAEVVQGAGKAEFAQTVVALGVAESRVVVRKPVVPGHGRNRDPRLRQRMPANSRKVEKTRKLALGAWIAK